MAVKFSQDIIPLTDLKTNPGRVVRQVADSRRPGAGLPWCSPSRTTKPSRKSGCS